VGLNMDKVLEMECKQEYEALLKSGMAWEFHPWLTGIWNNDKERFINEISNKVKNVVKDADTKN
jgi:hypothetical protein